MIRPSAIPPSAIPAASEVSVRLVAILYAVTQLISARSHIFAALAIPLHNRIVAASRRMATLLARLAEGKFRPRPHTHTQKPGTKGGPPPVYIPRRRAWLVVKLGYHMAAYTSHLEHLLRDPETQALLATAPPQALKSLGRTLRPIARLLGVTLPPALLPSPCSAGGAGGGCLPARPARQPKPPRPKPAPLPKLLPLYPQARPRDWPFMRFGPKIKPA